MSKFQDKPYYVGLEWTNEIDQDEMIRHLDRMSCMEFIPENFFDNRRMDFLASLRESEIPVLVHSVEMSLGTLQPLKEKHFERILEVADRVNCVNFSDHLSMTEAGDVEVGQLTPIPWTIECADQVCRNIDEVRKRVKVPYLIENITNRFLIPNCELSETQFINRILDRTGCGFLLDLNNVHTNATNHQFDPYEWIDEIDLNKVVAIHLAGGYVDEDGTLQDSHSRPTPEKVWDLFRYVCSRITPQYTIIEWTAEPDAYDFLLSQVDKADSILAASLVARQPIQAGVSL